MAEALLLSAFLPVVFEKAASLLQQGLGRMWGGDVQNELEKLKSTVSAVQAVLRDADRKQRSNEALKDWLSKLKDAAYEADDILDEFNYKVMRRKAELEDDMKGKVRGFFSSHNPLFFRKEMIRKINDVLEKFNRIAAERSNFHLQENSDPADRQPGNAERFQTHSFVDESQVYGREEEKKKIVELLIGSSDGSRKGVSILPIFGIGGLGKTTMAKLIYNDKRVAEHFQRRMWVCVSDDFNIPRIVKDIIESADESCGSSNMEQLQRKLREEVLSPKKFLLVLDDIWNENPVLWEELKVLLTSGAEGSAVVVTTRSEKISAIVGTVDPIRLHPLSDDDCWILFRERAFARGTQETEDLVAVGKAIVSKCGGLPLAVKALGSLMGDKREEWEWKSMLESEIWELEDDLMILPSLRLSYHQLPSYIKPCFAYCAIFPKDYEIDRDELIELWMANGFIPASDSAVEMEQKGRKIFEELVLRCFFQDLREDYGFSQVHRRHRTLCRMHDLIHDLAQSVMGSGCHVLDKPADISNREIRHLSVNIDPKLAPFDRVQNPKAMRTLLFLGGSYEFPATTLPETHLRVLSLRKCSNLETLLETLPISLRQLRHLRYLDLSYTKVATLPEGICNLVYLQTLNLDRCHSLTQLPRGLGRMSSLRHLHLSGCSALRYMPRGIGRLRFLRTLTAYQVRNVEGASGGLEELKDLNVGGSLELLGLDNVTTVVDAEAANLGSKRDLERLVLRWGPVGDELKVRNDTQVLRALKPPHRLKVFEVRSYMGTQFPTWLTGDLKLYTNLVEVCLSGCRRCKHLPQLGQLPSLERLEIRNMDSLKYMGGSEFYGSAVDGESTVFPSLKELWLGGNENLEEWSGVEGKASFPHLVGVQIGCCSKLTTMPRLPSVQYLKIDDCPSLLPSKGFFGSMKSLTSLLLDRCDKLVLLLEQDEDEAWMTSLQKLVIRSCEESMLSSPSLGLWRNLTSLQTLDILKCPGLVSLPVEVIQGLSSLKTLSISGCEKVIGLPDELPDSLQTLYIGRCNNFSSLPEGLGRLASLVSLYIGSSPNLTSLPEGMEFLKALQELRIWFCPNLISLPEGLQQRLPFLRRLSIRDCPSLKAPCTTGGKYWSLISAIPELEIYPAGDA